MDEPDHGSTVEPGLELTEELREFVIFEHSMKIFFSGDDSVKHLWEEIKGLSVSLVLLCTLPVSHEPVLGIVEHLFKFTSLGASHADNIGDDLLNELLQTITESRKFEFNIIRVDLYIER